MGPTHVRIINLYTLFSPSSLFDLHDPIILKKRWIEFMRKGSPKNKECAASVLLEWCSNNSRFKMAALQFGVYKRLIDIRENGIRRAQRKAIAIFRPHKQERAYLILLSPM
ncbi:hypothetical protein VNO77_20993 [Canavalia gladiata]|uniref:Uncharacterized protein n=1 Tax=Canavalia gladiata TaxID=3824 RepID=A0AAN9LQL9_CANGL